MKNGSEKCKNKKNKRQMEEVKCKQKKERIINAKGKMQVKNCKRKKARKKKERAKMQGEQKRTKSANGKCEWKKASGKRQEEWKDKNTGVKTQGLKASFKNGIEKRKTENAKGNIQGKNAKKGK